MESFNLKNPRNESEKLIAEITTDIIEKTLKFMHTHIGKNKRTVMSAVQCAAINYLLKITEANCNMVVNIVDRLDHIEAVREDINKLLDNLKTEIKSVKLN